MSSQPHRLASLCASAVLLTSAGSPPLRFPSPPHPGSSHFSPEGVVLWKLLGFCATPPSTRPCPLPLHPPFLDVPLIHGSPVATLADLRGPWITCRTPWLLGSLTSSFPRTFSSVPPLPPSPISCHAPGRHRRHSVQLFHLCPAEALSLQLAPSATSVAPALHGIIAPPMGPHPQVCTPACLCTHPLPPSALDEVPSS